MMQKDEGFMNQRSGESTLYSSLLYVEMKKRIFKDCLFIQWKQLRLTGLDDFTNIMFLSDST